MSLAPGSRLGAYEIASALGAGGMGEVYRARDARLGREVAIKIIRDVEGMGDDRLRRFEQEARAASSLNHPNIVTVYEVGEAEGVNFIVTELVDGETLRARLGRGSLGLDELLDVAVQAAGALVAAHRAGIVHRDVKPENIMVRTDGYVKVLDFGLAKAAAPSSPSVDTEARTLAKVDTDPGVLLGTALYMSPEQVRGLAVDARTDVWSLGVVLYEMATGRVPFSGDTRSDLIVAILDRAPAPLGAEPGSASAELERILGRALAKDREERYQTAQDLLVNLKRLRHRAETDSEAGRLASTLAGATPTATNGVTPTSEATARTTAGDVAPPRRRRAWRVAAALAAVIALVAAGAGLFRLLPGPAPARPFETLRATQATTVGNAIAVTVSPDGKYLAYVTTTGGKRTILVQQVASGGVVETVPASEVRIFGLAFSPDSNFLYYVARDANGVLGSLYQVSALGGQPRKLLDDVDTRADVSSDGSRIAFIRYQPAERESQLVVCRADGSEERVVARRGGEQWFSFGANRGPAWSPDGQRIAMAGGDQAWGGGEDLLVFALDGGEPQRVTNRGWWWMGPAAWLPDGSGLIATATDESSSSAQIWHLSYPEGEVRQVSSETQLFTSLGVTSDARTLAVVRGFAHTNISVAPAGDTARARRITSGTHLVQDVHWGPDDRIVYTSTTGGNHDMWAVAAAGGAPSRLTSDPHLDANPTVSADGRYVVFCSNRGGSWNIWRIGAGGGGLTQLTSGPLEVHPQCSPSGDWLIYHGGKKVWRMPIAGGEARELMKLDTVATISPDGTMLAALYRDQELTARFKLTIFSAEDGRILQSFETPRTINREMALKWMPDSKGICFVDERDVPGIWQQPLAGGAPVLVAAFGGDLILDYDWSRDGRSLAVAHGPRISDVYLLRES